MFDIIFISVSILLIILFVYIFHYFNKDQKHFELICYRHDEFLKDLAFLKSCLEFESISEEEYNKKSEEIQKQIIDLYK